MEMIAMLGGLGAGNNETPIYKKPVFWAVVGVGVAAWLMRDRIKGAFRLSGLGPPPRYDPTSPHSRAKMDAYIREAERLEDELHRVRRGVFSEDPQVVARAESRIKELKSELAPYWDYRQQSWLAERYSRSTD